MNEEELIKELMEIYWENYTGKEVEYRFKRVLEKYEVKRK